MIDCKQGKTGGRPEKTKPQVRGKYLWVLGTPDREALATLHEKPERRRGSIGCTFREVFVARNRSQHTPKF